MRCGFLLMQQQTPPDRPWFRSWQRTRQQIATERGKAELVRDHLADVEYRTMPCSTKQQAKEIERGLKRQRKYRFST
jgi:hypothetical protein